MFPYGMLAKPGPTMYERIRRALRTAGRTGINGRTMLTSEVLGKDMTLKQSAELNECVNDLIGWKEVSEEKRQLPGTGHDGPPVFDYIYTLAPTLRKT